MASYLRKCVCPGAPSPFNMNGEYSLTWSPSDSSLRNLRYHANTNTPWVRLFVSWRWLQPYDDTMLPHEDTRTYASQQFPSGEKYHYAPGSPAGYVAFIDEQIRIARDNPHKNLKVMLAFWEFPRWANGTATEVSAPNYNPNGDRGDDPDHLKPLEHRTPADVGPDSAWARIVDWLITRYKDQVYFLEIMNEPNLQWWPQQDPPGNRVAHKTAAQMFKTAQAIQQRPENNGLPRLVGPATCDNWATVQDSRKRTTFQSFVGNGTAGDGGLLSELHAIGFTGDVNFAWSHHNYTDVEYDIGDKSQRNNTTWGAGKTLAHDVRKRLEGEWVGWPYADGDNPYLLLTEGGARLEKIESIYGLVEQAALDKQAALLLRNWKRMKGDADLSYSAADAPGIGMLTQYLWHVDPNYGSALREPVATGGGRRPAYSTWADFLPAY
jgi:hypothetical protein